MQLIASKYNGKILRSWNPKGTNELDITMQIPFNIDPFTLTEELKNNSSVKHVEPNYICTTEVNDSYFSYQWSLNQLSDADIDAPEAWTITTGSSSIIIAVLDTGIPMSGTSLSHEDLDNTNHFVMVSGADVYNEDDYPKDDNKHGTAVLGIIGAETNNSVRGHPKCTTQGQLKVYHS